MKEVGLLSREKHPNVVKLVGYCTDNNELLLVFEYVPNKCLNTLLFGKFLNASPSPSNHSHNIFYNCLVTG